MLSEQEHLYKAWRNEDFYKLSIQNSDYFEWQIVILFYICLHYVDTILNRDMKLSSKLRYPHNHEDRNMAVANSVSLVSIYPLYNNLYERSLEARYTQMTFPDTYFNNLRVICYEPIIEKCRSVLGLPR